MPPLKNVTRCVACLFVKVCQKLFFFVETLVFDGELHQKNSADERNNVSDGCALAKGMRHTRQLTVTEKLYKIFLKKLRKIVDITRKILYDNQADVESNGV